jgi:hypothetical protein
VGKTRLAREIGRIEAVFLDHERSADLGHRIRPHSDL